MNKENFIKKYRNALLIIIGIFCLALGMLYFSNAEKAIECADLDCFITAANQCEKAVYEEPTDFGIVTFTTATNCTMTKEITELNEGEEQFIKDMILGKKMQCTYTKGNFNGQWIVSLIEGLEYCSGDLKDAIGDLIILS